MNDSIMLVICMALNAISTLLCNPLLGGGGTVRASEATELIALLGFLIARDPEDYDGLEGFTQFLEGIATANRAPTPDEWLMIRSSIVNLENHNAPEVDEQNNEGDLVDNSGSSGETEEGIIGEDSTLTETFGEIPSILGNQPEVNEPSDEDLLLNTEEALGMNASGE